MSVDLVREVENRYELTLLTEQSVETTPVTLPLSVPRPIGIERETGDVVLKADVAVEARGGGSVEVVAVDGADGAGGTHVAGLFFVLSGWKGDGRNG